MLQKVVMFAIKDKHDKIYNFNKIDIEYIDLFLVIKINTSSSQTLLWVGSFEDTDGYVLQY